MKRGLLFIGIFLLFLGASIAFVQITNDKVNEIGVADELLSQIASGEEIDYGQVLLVRFVEHMFYFRIVMILVITLLLFNGFLIYYLVSDSLDKDEKEKG